MTKTIARILTFACLFGMVGVAQGSIYDQDITPDVIFGSGNANGAWTTGTSGGVELGLRAKLRFDEFNNPQNIFNSNGDGTYTFAAGKPVGVGFGFAPGSSSTAVWNFEWSINADVNAGVDIDGNSTGGVVADYFYEISIDFDPGVGTNFLTFNMIDVDPMGTVLPDHALGNNSTGNGNGEKATSVFDYGEKIRNLNVAQNSWNMEFFDSALFPFNAGVAGEYTFELAAYQRDIDGKGDLVSQTSMTVIVTPEPSSVVLWSFGLFGLAFAGGRFRRR